jgi:hypothetical protein
MKAKRFFGFGLPVILLLAWGLVLGGCVINAGDDDDDDKDKDDPTFVAVTGITGVQTAAIVNRGLTLSGTVDPSNATNKTIVWSGNGVSNGILTAPSTGKHTVTATIANGASGSSSYTQNFEIEAFPAGSSNTNPFGTDANPFIWTMDGTGGTVYVTMNTSTWVATADGSTYNSGNYTWIEGTAAAQWTVTGGGSSGDVGLAIITATGKFRVANFTHEYSVMNGTFTQLDPSLTLSGTWEGDEPFGDGSYRRITATAGDFTESASFDGGTTWRDVKKGTYPTTASGTITTNPAICTITQVNISELDGGSGGTPVWKTWNDLDQQQKDAAGGSQTVTILIYSDRFEVYGAAFYKQQP